MQFKTWFAAPAALALFAVPALAQQPAAPAAAATSTKAAAGATVYDTSGDVVGSIEAVNGDLAVLSTGKSKVSIPLSSFGVGEKGPVLAMTRDQIDAQAGAANAEAAAAAEAKKKAQLVAGATVKDPAGGTVGTIKSVDAQYALVDTSKVQVRLPLTAFAASEDGPVIGMTKAELDAQAGAAADAPEGGASR
ncbi:hypothetical protein [Sphingomonas sp. KC8]|uniref:hypothetical protein n=1 Tax=Sphingomonas sp. KC8 TaxID=1030157 RepID=UPI00031940B2|nr:hypothetical protein [Sphingomonas sp. KC8]ARS27099.1 hypothetical protein KC8_07320 [Sphingomonas sp. KC8]